MFDRQRPLQDFTFEDLSGIARNDARCAALMMEIKLAVARTAILQENTAMMVAELEELVKSLPPSSQ
jgi:hypothetical protein